MVKYVYMANYCMLYDFTFMTFVLHIVWLMFIVKLLICSLHWKFVHEIFLEGWSEADLALLFIGEFEAQCSYKIVLTKKCNWSYPTSCCVIHRNISSKTILPTLWVNNIPPVCFNVLIWTNSLPIAHLFK